MFSALQREKGWAPGEGHSTEWVKRWGNVCGPYLHSSKNTWVHERRIQTGKLPQILAGGWAASLPRMLCSCGLSPPASSSRKLSLTAYRAVSGS